AAAAAGQPASRAVARLAADEPVGLPVGVFRPLRCRPWYRVVPASLLGDGVVPTRRGVFFIMSVVGSIFPAAPRAASTTRGAPMGTALKPGNQSVSRPVRRASKKDQILALYSGGISNVEDLALITRTRPSYVAAVLQESELLPAYFDLYTTTAQPMNV